MGSNLMYNYTIDKKLIFSKKLHDKKQVIIEFLKNVHTESEIFLEAVKAYMYVITK